MDEQVEILARRERGDDDGRMGEPIQKGFYIPAKFRNVSGHGSGVIGRNRELEQLMESKPPTFNAAMLFNHTEPRHGPTDIVKGLFGSDTILEDSWARYLAKAFASSTNELVLRQLLFQKARDDKLGPEQCKALFQRSMSLWKDMKKSRVQIVTVDELHKSRCPELTIEEYRALSPRARVHYYYTSDAEQRARLQKAEARGGKYHRRVQTEKGGYRYFYDEDKYKSSRHHQETGEDAERSYLSKCVGTMVQKSGKVGCTPRDLKSLVKKYGAKKVGDSLRASCESGVMAYKSGKWYANEKAG